MFRAIARKQFDGGQIVNFGHWKFYLRDDDIVANSRAAQRLKNENARPGDRSGRL